MEDEAQPKIPLELAELLAATRSLGLIESENTPGRIPLIAGIVIGNHGSKTGMVMSLRSGNKTIIKSMDGSKIGASIATNMYGRGDSYGVYVSGNFDQGNQITALYKTNNGVFILFSDTLVILNHKLNADIFPEHTDSAEHLKQRLIAVGYGPIPGNMTVELIEFCQNIHQFEKSDWEHFLWLVEQA